MGINFHNLPSFREGGWEQGGRESGREGGRGRGREGGREGGRGEEVNLFSPVENKMFQCKNFQKLSNDYINWQFAASKFSVFNNVSQS